MIPAEVLEAAAAGIAAANLRSKPWAELDDEARNHFLRDARAALEAAAPYIRAQALEDAADEFERRAKNVRNNTYLESPSYQSFVEHAENHERNARWLRLRADSERTTK